MIQIRQEGSPPIRYDVGTVTSLTLPDDAPALGFLEDAGQILGVEALLLKGELMDSIGELEAAQAAFDQADRLRR